jgi:hypothetical protein
VDRFLRHFYAPPSRCSFGDSESIGSKVKSAMGVSHGAHIHPTSLLFSLLSCLIFLVMLFVNSPSVSCCFRFFVFRLLDVNYDTRVIHKG